MLPINDIIKIAISEHDSESDVPLDIDQFSSRITSELASPASIPHFQHDSGGLTLVQFDCMLQDTGYPLEVYLSPAEHLAKDGVDMDRLQERAICWAVEIPGAQSWTRCSSAQNNTSLPRQVQAKFPLQAQAHKTLGAMLKMYTEETYRPASIVHIIGITSITALPLADQDDIVLVPAIHVLQVSETMVFKSLPHSPGAEIRKGLIDLIASAFDPADQILAELILLLLISAPLSRPHGADPIGTLSLNIIALSEPSTVKGLIGLLVPLLVNVPLSIPLLRSHAFRPKSNDSGGLDAGLLQLARGTTVMVDENTMGEGGQLDEAALRNLQCLIETLHSQTLRYEYPYMDDLKMDCELRLLVFSEAKSLIPVDLNVAIVGGLKPFDDVDLEKLASYRSYLAFHGRVGSKVSIPDETAEYIQTEFAHYRQKAGQNDIQQATNQLKCRLKIARLLAQSHTEHVVTVDIWQRAVCIHEDIESRSLPRPSFENHRCI